MNDIRKGERRMFIGQPTTELAEQFDAFKNEIFVNEEAGALRVGDGINLGGHEMARQDLANVTKETVLNKLAPINMDRTLYVSSTTGADTNTGLNSFEALGSLEEAMTRRELIDGKCSIIVLDSKTYDLSQGSLLDSDLTIIANDATITVTVADPLLPALLVQNGSRLDVANLVILSEATCNALGCTEQSGTTTNATITINRYTANQTGNTLVLADETAKLNLIIRASATDYAKINDEDLLSDANVQINFNAEQGGGGGLADEYLGFGVLSKPEGGMVWTTIDYDSGSPYRGLRKFTLKAGTVLRFPYGKNTNGTNKYKNYTVEADVDAWYSHTANTTPINWSVWSMEGMIANYSARKNDVQMALYAYLDDGVLKMKYDYYAAYGEFYSNINARLASGLLFPRSTGGRANTVSFRHNLTTNRTYSDEYAPNRNSEWTEAPCVIVGWGIWSGNGELKEANTIADIGKASYYEKYKTDLIPIISTSLPSLTLAASASPYTLDYRNFADVTLTVSLMTYWSASPRVPFLKATIDQPSSIGEFSYVYGSTIPTPPAESFTDGAMSQMVIIPKGSFFYCYASQATAYKHYPHVGCVYMHEY